MTPDLPPLPERDDLNMRASSTHVYTAAQMRTYAAEAVRVARLQAQTQPPRHSCPPLPLEGRRWDEQQ